MQNPKDCLVHLRTTESVKIRTLFEALNPILVEGSVEFTSAGMSIKGVNLVILCDLIVRAGDVEEYRCEEPQHVSINFNTLYTCLCSVGHEEAICLQLTRESLDAPTPYMSVFIISTSSEDEYVFHFQVTLLALAKEVFEVPDTQFQSVVSLPSASFHRVLRCCEKRGSNVQICTRMQSPTDNFIIFCTDGDEASVRFHMRFQPNTGAGWKDDSCLKLDKYSLKFLLLIAKATSLSNFVTVYLAKDFVLAVRYAIGTIGEITFCLAPMVEKATSVPPLVVPVRSVFQSKVVRVSADGTDAMEDEDCAAVAAADAAAAAGGGLEDTPPLPAPKKSKRLPKQRNTPKTVGGTGVQQPAGQDDAKGPEGSQDCGQMPPPLQRKLKRRKRPFARPAAIKIDKAMKFQSQPISPPLRIPDIYRSQTL